MPDFQNTRISLRRSPLSYSKVRSAIGPLVRGWPLKRRPRPGAYLNVGCGPHARREFFNIDYDFHDGVDLFHDLRKPLPMGEGLAEGLFSEHCLEHLTFEDARFAVYEFYRVLRPGGTLRVSVPDGEGYMSRYMAREAQPYAASDGMALGYTPMMSVNRIFYGSGHRFIYDFETLALLLTASGFKEVARVEFRKGRDPALLIDQEGRRAESLYVEAVR